MNDTRLIFDDDFYRVGAILLSQKYAHLEEQALNRFNEIGYPIPSDRFSTYQAYRLWLKNIMGKVSKSDYPGFVIENILSSFNVDPKNEKYRRGIAAKLFFNKQFGEQFTALQEPISLTLRKNNAQKELWVRIYPWTKREDYVGLWEEIKTIQPQLTGYRGKEKYQKTFKRDFQTYQLSLIVRVRNTTRKKPILDIMASEPEYLELLKEFKNENIDDHMRSIKSRFDKLLEGINIL